MPFLIFGLLAAAGTFMQMEQQRRNQEYQASVERANAIAKEQQAQILKERVEIEKRAADREMSLRKREYKEAAGTTQSLLASGNVRERLLKS